jgi:hypothetical protein
MAPDSRSQLPRRVLVCDYEIPLVLERGGGAIVRFSGEEELDVLVVKVCGQGRCGSALPVQSIEQDYRLFGLFGVWGRRVPSQLISVSGILEGHFWPSDGPWTVCICREMPISRTIVAWLTFIGLMRR